MNQVITWFVNSEKCRHNYSYNIVYYAYCIPFYYTCFVQLIVQNENPHICRAGNMTILLCVVCCSATYFSNKHLREWLQSKWQKKKATYVHDVRYVTYSSMYSRMTWITLLSQTRVIVSAQSVINSPSGL